MINIEKDIEKLVKSVLGEDVAVEVKKSKVGDYTCNVAFLLAPKLKKNPVQIAQEIAEKIKPAGLIEKAEAVNGHLNFYLNYSELARVVLRESIVEGYGKQPKKKKKIILEHTSVNPSGPVHVGRIRNSIIGDSLGGILKYAGYDVETHYFVNDVGKQIAIIAQGLDECLGADKEVSSKYSKYSKKPDFEIFFEYVAANKKFEEDDEFKKRVQCLINKAENGDRESLEKIKKAASTCLKGQMETFGRMGIKFDCFDFESREIESGRVFKVLEGLRKAGKWVVKEGVGSGLDLSGFGLEKRSGLSVLERADGTTVYLARDVSYHLQKLKEGDAIINVLGEDHKMEFLELAAILENFCGVKKPLQAVHFSFVSFAGEKLSTRKGQTAPVDMLLDEAVEKARHEIEKRGIATKDIAPAIGMGAVKYHIIKRDPLKPITFDWPEALSFEGETGPYLQYAHARCCRILEKSGVDPGAIKAPDCQNINEYEKELIRALYGFPDVVRASSSDLKPNHVANYLNELASAFSRFYAECPVIGSQDEKKRLLMVDATRNVLKTGLGLLGIEAPERM